MKNKLIDAWFDSPSQRSRIEEILYVRYGYDIALRFNFL